jgi:hypothetical protein
MSLLAIFLLFEFHKILDAPEHIQIKYCNIFPNYEVRCHLK